MRFQHGNKFGVDEEGRGYTYKHGLSRHPRYKIVIACLRQKGFRWSQLTLEQKKEMLNA